jgi:sugar phosphate isomerase/epimerase
MADDSADRLGSGLDQRFEDRLSRRSALRALGGTIAGALLGGAASTLNARAAAVPDPGASAASPSAKAKFELDHVIASSLYGTTPLKVVLDELPRFGSTKIDLWPKPHGSQREEVDSLGLVAVQRLLAEKSATVAVLTRYDLGLTRLTEELPTAKAFGTKTLVTGPGGTNKLTGPALKSAIQDLVTKAAPLVRAAEAAAVTVAVENHGGQLLASVDAVRWFLDLSPSPVLGLALAPYHLPQEPKLLADLIRQAGPKLALFYAWEHGAGCMKKQPRELELKQLPGRGSLDFAPLLAALAEIRFTGPTEIFMHPFPRGIPILDTPSQVTDELRRAKDHLAGKLPRA